MVIKKMVVVPICVAVVLDLILGVAIFMAFREPADGNASFLGVYLSQPRCYFWLFWTCCWYFCAYGLLKEYNGVKNLMTLEFPNLSEKYIKKAAKEEVIHHYAKICLLPCLLLPLAAVIPEYFQDNEYTWTKALLYLIPFVIVLILYLLTRHSRFPHFKNHH